MHYSKKQILEAYLNLASYGNNIEGASAASLIYFGKPVTNLNVAEALTLAVIPQNPNKKSQRNDRLRKSRYHLYQRWIKHYPKDANKSFLMTLPEDTLRIKPSFAPHFVNQILAESSSFHTHIISTLNLALQSSIEHITRRYIMRKTYLGLNNAAILLVDTRDMEIKALLGSTDFFNRAISGQINGTKINRSPGSILKPFIYALALDQGLIHPNTVLKDVPYHIGSYHPENFDSDFIGPIKAKEALVLSRNIPAIYLANQLNPSLYKFLQLAHIRHLKSESYYGLALALGGVELTMQELVSLYAMLVNGGLWQPLRLEKSQPQFISIPLLSKEASFLTLDMLKDTSSPYEYHSPYTLSNFTFSFKTGTSSGYRDAWTIGVVGPYVLAVWMGKFNNQGNPALIGKEIAAPLFFEIAYAMIREFPSEMVIVKPIKPLNLTKIKVCKASGLLLTRYCTEAEDTWFIPGKSPIKTDNIYREVAIDERTGLRTCHFDKHTRFEIYEFWPSDLLTVFRQAGIARRIPPPYQQSCLSYEKINFGLSPQIKSPQTQIQYITKLGSHQGITIPLMAIVDADIRYLYWFVNETFLGKSVRDKPFLWHASPGKAVIRVIDDRGLTDARDIIVLAI
jgi:penicillin-binding protein 1C